MVKLIFVYRELILDSNKVATCYALFRYMIGYFSCKYHRLEAKRINNPVTVREIEVNAPVNNVTFLVTCVTISLKDWRP